MTMNCRDDDLAASVMSKKLREQRARHSVGPAGVEDFTQFQQGYKEGYETAMKEVIMHNVERKAAAVPIAKCICHKGSVCTIPACDLYHHSGCTVHADYHANVPVPATEAKCVKCGHNNVVKGRCVELAGLNHAYGQEIPCGCKCSFPTGESAGRAEECLGCVAAHAGYTNQNDRHTCKEAK